MSIVSRFLAAPQRSFQIMIWTLLTAVLVTVVPLAGQNLASAPAPASVAQMAPAPAANSTPDATPVASGDVLVLAEGVPSAGAQAYSRNPSELLPAYRWRDSMELYSDPGVADVDVRISSQMAELGFSLAALVWWLLLALMQFALSLDIVTSFTHTINSFFYTTFAGLNSAGVMGMVGAAAAVAAAFAAFKGKLGQATKTILSAFLVLGLIQSLGVAAGSDKASTTDGVGVEYAAPAGTPAWFAVIGNRYVNEISFQTSTVFGTTAGITDSIRTGQAGPSDAGAGATCAYYNERLYATYNDQMRAKGGVNRSTGAALSMVSFMWQRSMYDSWTMANFGSSPQGRSIACHLLERNRQTDPAEQALIAGTGDKSSPYAGMHLGPFMDVNYDEKDNQASLLAWSACRVEDGAATVRPAWGEIPNMGDGNPCKQWFEFDEPGGLTHAQAKALGWNGFQPLDRDTRGIGGEHGAELGQINTMVGALWGHNGGQRFLAAGSALVTSGIYAYAFAGPAVGVLLSQFVLLFLLILLPWTLILLALPAKNGERNATGKRLLRLTGMAFGGKVMFLTVMGVTLTVMSALFSVTMAKPELTTYPGAAAAGVAADGTYTMWSIIVPAATIVVVRMVMKGLGLGNLMGLSGAMGFATAAVTQGKDGAKLKSGIAAATKGSKISGTLNKGKSALSKNFGGKALAGQAKKHLGGHVAGAAASAKRLRSDAALLEPDLAAKVSSGRMGTWQAMREQHFRNKALPDELARRVASGDLSLHAARAISRGDERRQRQMALERAAARAAESPDQTVGRLQALAGGAPLGAAQLDPHAGAEQRMVDGRAIAAENEFARRATDIATAGLGVGSEAWAAKQSDQLGGSFDQMVSAVRTDGLSGPLSAVQVEAARAGAKERAGEHMAANVVMGNSGAPALVVPSFKDRENIAIPADALKKADVAAQLLSNPLLLLEPDTVRQLEGESESEYHTRLTLELMDKNLMSASGEVIDVQAELGIDRYAPDYDKQLLHVVQQLSAGDNVLRSHQRASSAESMARVAKTVEVIHRTTDTVADRPDVAFEVAVKAAESYQERSTKTIDSLDKLRARIDVSVSDPIAAGRARTEILAIAESEAEDLVTRMNASIAELQFVSTASGASSEQDRQEAQAALGQRVEYVQAQGQELRDEIAHHIAKIVHAPESSRDELVELTTGLRNRLASLNGELEHITQKAQAQAARSSLEAAGRKAATRAAVIRMPAERPPLTAGPDVRERLEASGFVIARR